MIERRFAGYLNSKSVYGQSYSSVNCLRSMKFGRLLERASINPLTLKWNKRNKWISPKWCTSLYNYHKDTITFTQRQENTLFCKGQNRKPKVKFMQWRN